MPEILAYTRHGAAQVTPLIVEQLLHKLPMLKAEFTQIHAPKYPHLVNQLEFLADVVEDCTEGAYKDLPFVTYAAAIFALIYAHKKIDMIPETLPIPGHADESSIVRAVLLDHEGALRAYALLEGLDWKKITTRA